MTAACAARLPTPAGRALAATLISALAVCWPAAAAEGGERLLMRVELKGGTVAGTPLAWSASNAMLLARDGRLWEFSPQRDKYEKTTQRFRSYSITDMKSRLQQELGKQFEVTSNGPYLVCHPSGQRDLWGRRFEELYRSFYHYFGVRGFKPRSPEFPLVAVVLPDRRAFVQFAARDGHQVSSSVLGYYSPTTNRIALYDVTGGKSGSSAWHVNAETIIHEATHQTAYNTGIHSRFAQQPRWIVEGLGMLFEAPGVWNSRSHTRLDDRINQERLRDFRRYVQSGRAAGPLADYVGNDRLFDTAPLDAYAEAWALTFFLVETQPRKYFEYLTRVADREDFSTYPASERLADFADVFGDNFRMLESRYLRFIDQLP